MNSLLTNFPFKTEQNRLGERYSSWPLSHILIVTDIQHQLFVHTLHGKLHLAPLGEGIHNVLDIATGTGIWAIDFGACGTFPQSGPHCLILLAVKYPTANVLGTDLSPIQPELSVFYSILDHLL